MVVQWLKLPMSSMGGIASISGWKIKIPRAVSTAKKKNKKVVLKSHSKELLDVKEVNPCKRSQASKEMSLKMDD